MSRVHIAFAVLLACGAALGAGCGADDRPVVLAASSLRSALAEAPAARISFAASGTLAEQLRRGADVDVVVLAGPGVLAGLAEDGLIDAPIAVARNGLAVLVPPGNPRGIDALADLTRPGLRLAVAAPGVPLGDATRSMLRIAEAGAVLRNVVTEEASAAGVVGKVALGEVDAGIGYGSDLRDRGVGGFVLPPGVQVQVRYGAARVRSTHRDAQARTFLSWLTGAEGARALRSAGLLGP